MEEARSRQPGGVASPKKWGPKKFSLLVSSEKLQYTCMGPPYIKHYSTDLHKSQEGSEQK